MFDRIRRGRILSAGGLGVAGGVRRHVSVWLAILGLYVQLFAAGLCTAGLALNPAAGDPGAFPICHARADGNAPAPAQGQVHHPCPFCALHCQGAMVMAPSVGAPERFVAVASQATETTFVAPTPARFRAGAPPRGPPPSV